MTDAVKRRDDEIHHREPSRVKGRVVLRADVVVHVGNEGGLHEVASCCKGLAQADGCVPVAVHTDGTACGREAGGLSVDGEQHVGVRQDTAVPNHQTGAVVGDDLSADVELGACNGVGCNGVNHHERQRSDGNAGEVGTR